MSRIIYKDEPIVEYYDDSEQMLYQVIVALISGADHLGSNLKGLCLGYLNKLQQENQKYKEVFEKIKSLLNDYELQDNEIIKLYCEEIKSCLKEVE